MTASIELARRWSIQLCALAGGADVQRKAAARLLRSLSPTEITQFLADLMTLVRARWTPAAICLESLMHALHDEAAVGGRAEVLRQVALLHQQPRVQALLIDATPVQEYQADAAARAEAKRFTLPLGVLKTRARLTRNPDELARLTLSSTVAVVRELLRNPRLTEELVLRIATRRPARPEPLVEIWRSPRWGRRLAIRRSLVLNPFLPPDVGAKLVPLLGREDLRLVQAAATLHESLRGLAGQLLSED